MRRNMTKEVTKTTIKVAKMEMEEGVPKAILLPNEVVIGNVTLEKAQKEVNKMYNHPVTVLGVEVETQVYEMPVEEFIRVAKIKTVEED